MPFVACNELAIATKSIASVCPHAERAQWVPFQGGTAVWAALSNTSSECVVAKANEADCFANAEVQTREERGTLQFKSTPPHTLAEHEKALRSYHGVLLTKLFAQSGGFRRF